MNIPRNNQSEICNGCDKFNDMDVDDNVDKPEEKEQGINPCTELQFKPHLLIVTRTDSEGLKCTQERGGADRNTPRSLCMRTKLSDNQPHSVNALLPSLRLHLVPM